MKSEFNVESNENDDHLCAVNSSVFFLNLWEGAFAMAGGRTQKNKSHKTRFASKASRNAHKLSG